MRLLRSLFPLLVLGSSLLARAQAPSLRSGFDLHRGQLTAPGESSFLVDSPRFSAGTWSVGLSLDYAHRPLVLGVEDDTGRFQQQRVLIEHQLLGDLEVAGSFCSCARVSVSLPLTLLERGPSETESRLSTAPGTRALAASATRSALADAPDPGIALVRGLGVSDPRLGMLLRVYGQPGQSPLAVSLGADLWIPWRKFFEKTASHTSDLDPRVMVKGVLTGVLPAALDWSLTGAFLLRSDAHLGALPGPEGSTAGSELQVGAGLHYAPHARLSVGPEARYTTLVTPSGSAFKLYYSSLEALLGLNLTLWERLHLGVAAGAGVLRQPGTPDVRLLVRVSYDAFHAEVSPVRLSPPPPPPRRVAPAPPVFRIVLPTPEEIARVQLDRDGDGVLDTSDECPDEPMGARRDPRRLGCPATARDDDHDNIPEPEDACPTVPGVPSPLPGMNGCPPGLVEVREQRLVPTRPIVFAINTGDLLPESIPVLQSLLEALQARPWIHRLRIEGHTDDRGNAEANRALSQRRAGSVRQWLVGHGIAAERLEAEGYGSTRPIADNATAEGRTANRRVEFIILEQAGAPAPSPSPTPSPP